jgi:fatty acid desaturase
VIFALSGNTLFALLHEAVHGHAHAERTWNTVIGRITALAFPTSFTAQRHFHLGHHRRNRGGEECWDLFLPDDVHWLKRVQWYSILIGGYWLTAPIFCLLALVCPGALRTQALRSPTRRAFSQFGAAAMLRGLPAMGTIRIESLAGLSLHLLLPWLLGIDLIGWLACYGAFAWSWSSLQYADHAFTARHRQNGAWDLRVTPWVRWCFLNYHLHRAHHRQPHLPWTALPSATDRDHHRPTFWGIYLRMWLGPRPVDDARLG